MFSSKVRFALSALLMGSVTAVSAIHASADPPASSKDKPGQGQAGRKTTEAPVPAKGKLGQDLFLAIDHHDLAGIQALLKQGADPNARNGLEFTPLFMAAASHQQEAMQALLSAGAKLDPGSPYGSPLTFAAMSANGEGAKLLLSQGANIKALRADDGTPLMMACNAGEPGTIQVLLSHKAEVNAKDNDGATALNYAARQGNLEAGRLLLAAGATVDSADSHRRTPLMYAAMTGHADFVQMLLKSGAKANAKDDKGRTALLLAAKYGDYPDVIKALVVGGANANAADAAGARAAALAAARGHSASLAVLIKPGAAGSASVATRTPEQAVQISLKTLEASMLRFNQRTGCISCHQEGLGRIATGAARDHGFKLDPAVESAQQERINGLVTGLQPLHEKALEDPETMKQVPLIEINEVGTIDTWLMAGMDAHKQPPSKGTEAMALVLARQQMPDGHWGFSLPRAPMQSSFFTFTALAVRVLRAYGPATSEAEVTERIGRAKTWLLTAQAQNSEDRASRLLGLKWAGAGEEEIGKAMDAIRADQKPDGGWSQLPNLQSDAYATGQALYALHLAGGLPVADPVYARGVQFLLRTQDEDGSWFVNKRAMPANNYFDSGFPHGESQYSSFNGTCWATMALLETLDHSGKQSAQTTR